MGKVRINTIGDETLEKKQKEKAEKRKEAKKVSVNKAVEEHTEKSTPEKQIEKRVEPTGKKSEKKVSSFVRSKKYQATSKLVEKNRFYLLHEALELLPKLKISTFDETVELHINTPSTGISGSFVLPHGTGKSIRVAILNISKDQAHADILLEKIEKGTIDFDILIATPDSMTRLAKVARILGPKGLMPNPKNGTVTTKPEEAAKQYEGGQIFFKTEAKTPVIHLSIGKLSFGIEKLEENITTALKAIKAQNLKKITLKSTMSVGIKIQYS